MPLVDSTFRPPLWLANAHVQTILGAMIRRDTRTGATPHRLELPDGDFVDLEINRTGSRRTAILSHGLEGSAKDTNMGGIAQALIATGWNVIAWSFRGCSGTPNRLARAYHSGDTDDLRHVIDFALRDAENIALFGFSLGGNLTLKYLGEQPPHPAVAAAMAVSAPIHLASSARALDTRWRNFIYRPRLIRRLVEKVRAKAADFPTQLDVAGVEKIRTFRDFDDRFTAPMHGFRDAAHYWTHSSARQYLPAIAVPTLLLNALDDPFLTPECFPWDEARASDTLFLEPPRHGGHLGFLDSLDPKITWLERRAADFLGAASFPLVARP